jgi:Cu+-exporting ATPase
LNKIFKIEGMTCASCVNLIETESKKLIGLDEINVSFASEKAVLKFQEKNFDPKTFLSLLESLGYRGIDTENEISQKREGIKSFFSSQLNQSLLLLFFGSFLMFLMFNMNFFSVNHRNLNLIQLISCSLILSFYLKFYFNNIKRFLLNYQSNMHTLIGIGLITNIIYSYYLFFVSPHSHLYVEGIPFIL